MALGFTPLYFSIPVVILAAFFLLRLATNPRWNSDAAIAVMSASALAVGIIVISRTSGMTTDVDNYMFGSVLAMTWADVACLRYCPLRCWPCSCCSTTSSSP